MIKVFQTVVGKGKGNCAQAAFASLLEVPLEEAINIMDYSIEEWHTPLCKWFDDIGYEWTVHSTPEEKDKAYEDLKSQYAIKGCFYASVPSKNFKNTTHAVIINRDGIVVHDPHPEQAWVDIDVVDSGDLNYWYLIDLKEEGKLYDR